MDLLLNNYQGPIVTLITLASCKIEYIPLYSWSSLIFSSIICTFFVGHNESQYLLRACIIFNVISNWFLHDDRRLAALKLAFSLPVCVIYLTRRRVSLVRKTPFMSLTVSALVIQYAVYLRLFALDFSASTRHLLVALSALLMILSKNDNEDDQDDNEPSRSFSRDVISVFCFGYTAPQWSPRNESSNMVDTDWSLMLWSCEDLRGMYIRDTAQPTMTAKVIVTVMQSLGYLIPFAAVVLGSVSNIIPGWQIAFGLTFVFAPALTKHSHANVFTLIGTLFVSSLLRCYVSPHLLISSGLSCIFESLGLPVFDFQTHY